VQALLAHEAEHAPSPPQRLATLMDHTESDINVVRFAPDGDYLASAGDDQSIILYRMFPGRGDASFGSGGEGPNQENWRAVRLCRCAHLSGRIICVVNRHNAGRLTQQIH
jgi:hypothetical protein